MKFGYFDDERSEYVITTPRTPLPWINYLGSEDLFALCSNTAGGYSFYRDARLRRITRYRYNNSPLDSDGLCASATKAPMKRLSRCSRMWSSVSGTPWTIPPTSSATSPPVRSRSTGRRSITKPSTASAAITTPCSGPAGSRTASTRPARPLWACTEAPRDPKRCFPADAPAAWPTAGSP